MPQALWAALREDGHDVIRPEDLQIRTPMSAEDMIRFARLAAPDVIMCPFLKEVVPPEVCERTTTWILHPGIRGDRGPSSLSWAILEGEPRWGLTMVRAEPASTPEELDGGNVGAWREFAMPAEATLGEVYAQHVLPASIDCAREILARMAIDPAYHGMPLASFGRAAVGRHRPALRQDRLAFAWDDHPDEILRRVHAAPSACAPNWAAGPSTSTTPTRTTSPTLVPGDFGPGRTARASSWPTGTARCWSRPAPAARCGSATPRSSLATAAGG
jgi:putative two-component system protein, hydrogenase maturation factor HypX/HoxX